jgi:hypothetical protein
VAKDGSASALPAIARRQQEDSLPTRYTIAPDDAIDLQMHTLYSDGAWQPDELMDYLAEHHLLLVPDVHCHLAWLGRFRCLSKDYEFRVESSEGFLYLGDERPDAPPISRSTRAVAA